MRRHLRWGIFCLNPADPRGFVPKSLGWTVNYRHPGWVYLQLFMLALSLAFGAALVVAIC